MSEELPEFLGGDAPVDQAAQAQPPEAPAAEAPAPAAPAAGGEPQAPAAAPAQPTAEVAAPAPAGEPPVVHHVPLATHLDVRDRLRAAEQRAAQAEEWRRQQEAAKAAPQAPDPYADPDGYRAHQEQQFAAQMRDQALFVSERMATVTHGPDVVRAAKAWYDSEGARDQFLDQKVRASADPYETVIGEWKRTQLLSRIKPEDLDAFQQWQASQGGNPAPGATPAQPAGQQPPGRPQAPRPSIASGPSAGAHADPVPPDGAEAFGRMFGT